MKISPMKYYYYNTKDKIIFVYNKNPNNTDNSFLGKSNNTNIKMAAAIFMQVHEIKSGFKIKQITS